MEEQAFNSHVKTKLKFRAIPVRGDIKESDEKKKPKRRKVNKKLTRAA